MKKGPKPGDAALLVLAAIVILMVLFYLSPFSETLPAPVCYDSFEGVGGYPYGDVVPVCGNPISGKGSEVYFPFRRVDDQATKYCLAKEKAVENLCGITPDQVLMKNYVGSYDCNYVLLGNDSSTVQGVVHIIKIPPELASPGESLVGASIWKAPSANVSFRHTCTETSLVNAGS